MNERFDCGAAMRQLWDFLDEELSEERMVAVRVHLERCQGCWPHYDFEKAFLDAVARAKQARSCPEEVRRRVLDTLRSAGYTRS